MGILRRVVFYISSKKVGAPATRITFLGILVDLVSLELSVPLENLLN